MSIILPGGIALITGAASGIGRATAIAYARSGVEGLSLADISSDALEEVLQACGKVATNAKFRAIPVKTDVRKELEVKDMVEETMSTFGRIDYAANIAGLAEAGEKTSETPLEVFDRINDVNTRGVFISMREEIKAMLNNKPWAMTEGGHQTRGAILNMGSIMSKISAPGHTSYVTSKHAVSGMTKAAASSHGTDLIRINTLCPGFVQTPLIAEALKQSAALARQMIDRTAMKRLAAAEELANQVVWMNSPMNSYMTGADVVVDGGFTS